MKKLLVGIIIVVALMIFVSQVYAPKFAPAEEISQTSLSDEDLQASLLSVNAGTALLPFILILAPGGIGFFAYLNRQKKIRK